MASIAAAFTPRLKQQAILDYAGGKMGVSAVPGSGKTWTLSLLAAHLIAEGGLEDDQEVLIVTLVNSAVSNFAGRVAYFIQRRGLLPGVGYRVRTLHGLAHDIVRERPELAGLSNDFQIMDEKAALELLKECALTWVREHPEAAELILAPDLEGAYAQKVRRENWPDLVTRIATSFIKQAKDLQMTPATLRYRLAHFGAPLPLMELGCAIYTDYQRALAYRGMVDFDDLIRLALHTLSVDPEFLARLRQRWPYILEDEAQDSSRLQEEILKVLTGPDGNWVRVGDPNQAIYETFTTASPHFLRDFMERQDVLARDLPNSGRSMPSVIALANQLIRWTRAEHPVAAIRAALAPPYVEPAPPGDPQPNPADNPREVVFVRRGLTPEAEVKAIADSLARWLPQHPQETVAVLTPRNQRGAEVVDELKARGLPYIEFLRSTRATRDAAGALGNVVAYLADPVSAKKLSNVYRVWRRADRNDPLLKERFAESVKALRGMARVEDFLCPRAERDWLAAQVGPLANAEWRAHLDEFRVLVRRWQAATILPIDHLILTLAQDLFTAAPDLAIAHKLAVVLRAAANLHPDWRLLELTQELAAVARNERKFLGFTDEDIGFNPDEHRGAVVVATMHKAKGLEWDRVYLMSVNDYDFPSALAQDAFLSEPRYVRDRLNVEAEVLAQLKALHEDPELFYYDEGLPTLEARYEYAAERLRLLYVGITRARKSLIVTWNTGRDGRRQPAIPLLALQTWWEERQQQSLEPSWEDVA